MNTAEELNDLMGGAPTASFLTVGTVHQGRIRSFERTQQRDMETGSLKFWDDGRPMVQYVFVLETSERDPEIVGDDGVRRIFAKAQMLGTIRTAIRVSGHAGNIVGGNLAVQYSGDGKPKTKGYNPPKEYQATFSPPAETVEFLAASAPSVSASNDDGDYDDDDGPF